MDYENHHQQPERLKTSFKYIPKLSHFLFSQQDSITNLIYKKMIKNYSCYYQILNQMLFYAIIISLLVINTSCVSYQRGHWNKSVYDNSSFLFNFLNTQSGFALLQYRSGSDQLLVTLSNQDDDESYIKIKIKMYTVKYMTDAMFHLNQTHIAVTFQRGSTTYGEEQLNTNNHLRFNITYISRKSLELKTTVGQFMIKVEDLYEKSSSINYIAWLLFVLIFLGYSCILIKAAQIFKVTYNDLNYSLGVYSTQMIGIWIFLYTYSLWDETFYLKDFFNVSLLSFLVFLLLILEIVIFAFYFNTFLSALRHLNQLWAVLSLFLFQIAGLILLLQIFNSIKDKFTIQLWYLLLPILVFQFCKIFLVKKVQRIPHLGQELTLSFLVYIFPIAIFPIFRNDINYPEIQSQNWWIYLVFYAIEATFYLVRMVKIECGLQLRMKRIKFMIMKFCNKKDYITLQESLCSICFKEVQISQVNMAAAGEIQLCQWIKAPCNHYFHRACLKKNINIIDKCYFDNTKWTPQFENIIRQ